MERRRRRRHDQRAQSGRYAKSSTERPLSHFHHVLKSFLLFLTEIESARQEMIWGARAYHPSCLTWADTAKRQMQYHFPCIRRQIGGAGARIGGLDRDATQKARRNDSWRPQTPCTAAYRCPSPLPATTTLEIVGFSAVTLCFLGSQRMRNVRCRNPLLWPSSYRTRK